MSGYVPLFDSLTTGTLCGRWPDVGLWPIVLSLSDRYGVVDVTPDYIARITGLAAEEVTACMQRFCGPDQYSRSSGEGGARLVLIDPEHRDWGWRIVNHGKYREKARKAAYDADRTESGRDAERKRAARAASRDSQTCPDASRDVPLSDSDSDSDKTREEGRPQSRPVPKSFHQEVISAYHELLPNHPRVKAWTKKRHQALNARIAERMADGKPANEVTYWRGFFEKVATSDFLCGRATDFVASLEWLLKPENFLKTIEGNYDSRGRGKGVHANG